MTSLSLTIPPDLVDEIAEKVAHLLAERNGQLPEYLKVDEAAAYMRCSRQRVYDLSSTGRLRVRKDGSRSLFKRSDLEAYLSGEATS
jgi:excisionase family DNA binding protein